MNVSSTNFLTLAIAIAMPVLSVPALSGCSKDPKARSFRAINPDLLTPPETNAGSAVEAAITRTYLGATVQFREDNFFSIESPNSFGCAGDVHTYFRPMASGLSTLSLQPYPASTSNPNMTLKPAFIKNVYVDLTDSSYNHPANLSLGCAVDSGHIPAKICAHFDRTDSLLQPTQHYGSQAYLMQGIQCANVGPLSGNPDLSSLFAGGASFDLAREEMGENEDLLLTLTYYPFSSRQITTPNPNGPTENYPISEEAQFEIYLQTTQLPETSIRSLSQPRYLNFFQQPLFPKTVANFHVLSPQMGGPREEQIYLPLSAFPSTDRIRIERVSGSGMLIAASLLRTGAVR